MGEAPVPTQPFVERAWRAAMALRMAGSGETDEGVPWQELTSAAIALGLAVIFIIGGLIGRAVLLKVLRGLAGSTDTKMDDIAHHMLMAFLSAPLIVALCTHAAVLVWPVYPFISKITLVFVAVMVARQLIVSLETAADYIGKNVQLGPHSKEVETATRNFLKIVKFLLFLGAAVFILDNLGFSVGSLLASFGVGGAALAVWAQGAFSDVLAGVSLLLDRPFEVDDIVEIGGLNGVVTDIGMRSVRIRALSGELVVMPNAGVLGARVRNFTQAEVQNRSVSVGVASDTSLEKLRQMPDILREAVSTVEDLKVDQVYFQSFGDYTLNFEVRYSVLSNNAGVARTVLGKVNSAINERMTAERVNMPFPTHTTQLIQMP